MNPSLKAVGFSNITDKKAWDELVTEVFHKPSYSYMREHGEDNVILESYKQYAQNIFLIVRVLLIEEEILAKPKLKIEHCEPYVATENILEIQDLEVEDTEDEFIYYAVCEEVTTGMQIVFLLQNVIEYLDYLEFDEVEYSGARIVGMATEGTIILPIEKTKEDDEYEMRERKFLRDMLQRAKQGDKEAIEILEREELQMDEQLRERLKKEDFLTVMDGYFLPATEVEATYAVLGTIKSVDLKENSKTKEKMYWFSLDVNGMPVDVIINKEDLIGTPYVGMRFMGTCLMQGIVQFENTDTFE